MRLNPAARALRLGWARQVLTAVESRPVSCLAGVTALYAVVSGLTWLAPPIPWGPFEPVDDYFRDLQTVNLALFGAQATLLGLVYPLVIALVSMMFGARSTSDRRLDVYFTQTGAVPVGGLALGFVGAVALQALSYGQLLPKVVGAITVLNSLWFVINLLGLGFFVLKSLDFIRPARKLTLLKRYLANVAFRDQLKILMARNQWQLAPTYGHLPSIGSAENPYVPGLSFAQPLVTASFNGDRQLKDIRMGLLDAVLAGRAGDSAPIEFPLLPGVTYSGRVNLATGGGDLLWVERLLIHLAFRFGAPPKLDPAPTGEDILGEAVGDLLGLLNTGRFDEFDARLDEAIALHVLLYQLAQEPERIGKFNYAADGHGLGTVARSWVSAYRPLILRAGEALDQDGRCFEACAYLPGSLVRELRTIPFQATEVVVDLSMILFRALVSGAARRHLESSSTPPTSGRAFAVAGRGAEYYRRNWISLVAGWERVGTTLITLPRDENNDWAELSTILPGLEKHLRMSALMVGQAAQVGEIQAIGWTSDLLLKWRDQTRQTLGLPDCGFALKRAVITMALTTGPWDDVAKLSLSQFDQAFGPGEVFGAAIGNLWQDTLTVLATTLVESFGPAHSDGRMHTGAAVAARALFRNEAFDPGAAGHPRSRPLDSRGVLESILRIAGAGERFEKGYAGQLSSLAEVIRDLEGPNYVSARIYSWGGSAGFEDQTHAQLLLLAAARETPGRRRGAVVISDDLKALLLPRDDRSKRRIQAHLKAIADAAGKIDANHGRAVISTLLDHDVDPTELTDRLADAVALVEQCYKEIQAVRDAEISAAALDPARLVKFADDASALAFVKQTAGFPVRLFDVVTTVETDLTRKTYRTNARKGAFTTPVMADSAEDLGELIGRQMVDLVGRDIFWDITQSRGSTERRPASAAAYWTALKVAMADVRAAGQTPIIVRGDRSQPTWLSHWHFPPSGIPTRPSDMMIERREGVDDDAYDFHLNGVAVYSCPGAFGATWCSASKS